MSEIETNNSGQGEVNDGPGQTGEDASSRLERLESDLVVQRLLADPDVQNVLKARREGKVVKVVEETTEEPKPEAEPGLTEGLDEENPMRGPLAKIEEFLKNTLDSKLGDIADRLKQVEALAEEVQKRDVVEQVQSARSKYNDFDQHRTEMVQISQANPGLTAEQVYILARLKKNDLRLPETQTFSEKPTAQPRSSATKKDPKPNEGQRSVGKAAWNKRLSEVLSGLNLDTKGS